MYHIKPDKRSQNSAKLICQGLLHCLKKKDFSQVTITDLQKEASIGRATFYRLFDNLHDVLVYMCDSVFDPALLDESPPVKNFEGLFVRLMHRWMTYEKVLDALLNAQRVDIIYKAHKNIAQTLQERLYPYKNISSEQMDYIGAIITSLMGSLLVIWVEHGKKESPEQILGYIREVTQTIDQIGSIHP